VGDVNDGPGALADTSVVGDEASAGPPDRRPRARSAQLEPGHLAVLAVLLAFVGLTIRPIGDIDSYWHVLVGRELLETGRLAGLGDGWTLWAPETPWRTSQWASEVVMAWLVDAFGWAGLVWARTALVVVLLGSLTAMLLRRAAPAATAVVLALVAIPSNATLQERPMLVSFVMLVWVSGAAYDLLRNGRRPSLVAGFLLPLVWAQFHGMWVLAPFTFALVAGCLLLEQADDRRPRVIRSVQLVGLSTVAGCLTPIGVSGLILPLTFRSATDHIAEWQRVPFVSAPAVGLLLMATILVIGWARSSRPTPLGLVVFTLVWVVVGMTAFRNILPAAIMLAPHAAAALSSAGPLRSRPVPPDRAQALAVVAGVFAVLGVIGIVVATARIDPLDRATPVAIAERIATAPGDQRVLNAYNASGVLVAFGGDRIAVAIDGRADRYGADYIERYLDAQNLRGDWEAVLDEVDPTAAVLLADSPLAVELVEGRGWSLDLADGDYVLLSPPGQASG
jgi:hypothetical protein